MVKCDVFDWEFPIQSEALFKYIEDNLSEDTRLRKEMEEKLKGIEGSQGCDVMLKCMKAIFGEALRFFIVPARTHAEKSLKVADDGLLILQSQYLYKLFCSLVVENQSLKTYIPCLETRKKYVDMTCDFWFFMY
ncbi:DgyrCDS9381 [Dimorphilus gyrociliatus]|uniref:DgyrCDS9381 n=1 Tax=Dimorphilus gyrociliatus TaxID=2664684 RepID=A0A7I8VY53_9ANNE|nr:DgyrCDS9381 [Dimorphilus gyrociliatus]